MFWLLVISFFIPITYAANISHVQQQQQHPLTAPPQPVRFFIDEGYFLPGDTEILRAYVSASNNRLEISGESTAAFSSVKGYYVPERWDVYWTMRQSCHKAYSHMKAGQMVNCIPGVEAISLKRRFVQTWQQVCQQQQQQQGVVTAICANCCGLLAHQKDNKTAYKLYFSKSASRVTTLQCRGRAPTAWYCCQGNCCRHYCCCCLNRRMEKELHPPPQAPNIRAVLAQCTAKHRTTACREWALTRLLLLLLSPHRHMERQLSTTSPAAT